MKKTIIMCALMALVAINANAQLKISSGGKVTIGTESSGTSPILQVGHNSGTTQACQGIRSVIKGLEYNHNVAIAGSVKLNSSNTGDRNFGVIGTVDANPLHGCNYGVCGSVSGNNNGYGGTGVLALDSPYYLSVPPYIQGFYAAYFIGATNLVGQTMAQEIYTPADNNLSENVASVATRSGEGMLDNLLKMNVREFNMKSSLPVNAPENLDDMTEEKRQSYEYLKKDQEKMYSRRHFGLSAQELKEIYPDLVLEAQDGYLYVNYTELVPVLIRAIQELKTELDDVKGANGARIASSTTVVNSAAADGNVLYQNTPNPFKEQTTIRFSLADDTQSASICIFDMTGKMLKNLPVSTGDSSVSLNGWELGEGMFLYTLIVNGKEIDTKRMIITK